MLYEAADLIVISVAACSTTVNSQGDKGQLLLLSSWKTPLEHHWNYTVDAYCGFTYSRASGIPVCDFLTGTHQPRDRQLNWIFLLIGFILSTLQICAFHCSHWITYDCDP